MAKFSFRLQAVLNVKMQQEDHLKNELGKAIQRLDTEKRRLEALEGEMKDLTGQFNEKARKTAVRELIEYNQYLSVLTAKIKEQKEKVNCAARNVDKVREELLKAVKERQILDKFKDKKHEEFLLEQKRLEQITNDEIVSYKNRKNSSGD